MEKIELNEIRNKLDKQERLNKIKEIMIDDIKSLSNEELERFIHGDDMKLIVTMPYRRFFPIKKLK